MVENIAKLIFAYIEERMPWACTLFLPEQLLIMKGMTREQFTDMIVRRDKPRSDIHISSEDLLKTLTSFGQTLPAITIEENSSKVQITYGTTILGYYSDPNFFAWLDRALEHIKNCDSLSTFPGSDEAHHRNIRSLRARLFSEMP